MTPPPADPGPQWLLPGRARDSAHLRPRAQLSNEGTYALDCKEEQNANVRGMPLEEFPFQSPFLKAPCSVPLQEHAGSRSRKVKLPVASTTLLKDCGRQLPAIDWKGIPCCVFNIFRHLRVNNLLVVFRTSERNATSRQHLALTCCRPTGGTERVGLPLPKGNLRGKCPTLYPVHFWGLIFTLLPLLVQVGSLSLTLSPAFAAQGVELFCVCARFTAAT